MKIRQFHFHDGENVERYGSKILFLLKYAYLASMNWTLGSGGVLNCVNSKNRTEAVNRSKVTTSVKMVEAAIILQYLV